MKIQQLNWIKKVLGHRTVINLTTRSIYFTSDSILSPSSNPTAYQHGWAKFFVTSWIAANHVDLRLRLSTKCRALILPTHTYTCTHVWQWVAEILHSGLKMEKLWKNNVWISKAKIIVFWNFFFTPLAPSGVLRLKIFQKTMILAFEANSALSRENETKIVKITHSGLGIWNPGFG